MRITFYIIGLLGLCITACSCATTGEVQSMAKPSGRTHVNHQAQKKEIDTSRKSVWGQMPWAIQKNRGRKRPLPAPPSTFSKRETEPTDRRAEKVVEQIDPVRQVAWETRLQELYDVPVSTVSNEAITTSRLPPTSTVR